MSAERGSPSPWSDGYRESRFYLTDIVVEYAEGRNSDVPVIKISELCIFGLMQLGEAEGSLEEDDPMREENGGDGLVVGGEGNPLEEEAEEQGDQFDGGGEGYPLAEEGEGDPLEDDGIFFSLCETSPQRWIIDGPLDLFLQPGKIDCVVSGEAGEEIGYAHLDWEAVLPNERISTPLTTRDTQLKLLIAWSIMEVPFEGGVEDLSVETQLEDADNLYQRFKRTGHLTDISDAIRTIRRVMENTADDDLDFPSISNNLGVFLMCRFDHTGNLEDLVEAIKAQTGVIDRTPEGDADLPSCLINLGNLLRRRFKHTANLDDVSEAIRVQTRAVNLTPQGHPNLSGRLTSLGNSFLLRFKLTGEFLDIAEAIRVQTQAVDLAPEEHEDLPMMLSNLGNSFRTSFERTGNLQDVTEAIRVQTRAVDLIADEHTGRPIYLTGLGKSLLCRFQRTGNLEDLAEAIRVQMQAIDLTPEGHAALPGRLTNIGVSFLRRFERTGDLQDISESIRVQMRAVDLASEGGADFHGLLNNLGNSLLGRFERTGDLQDISEAIRVQTQAVALMPEGHAGLPNCLTNLGNSFQSRFERIGHLQDIAEAIRLHTQAIDLAPEGHANLSGWFNNLGLSFICRFERTGGLQDLAEAIRVQMRAVALAPEGHADLPGWLSNLGHSSFRRFLRTGNLEDLSEAIRVQNQAVDLAPDGDADLPAWLTNLGNSLLNRFQRTGDSQDIADAIRVQKKAIDLAPEGHAYLPRLLTNHGNSFLHRFKRTGVLQDISEAIKLQAQAVNLAPEGHPDLSGWLCNLGRLFRRRFKRTGNFEDFSEAIRLLTQAVDLTPEEHTSLPIWLYNLAGAWHQRFISSNLPEHLEEALRHYKSAATFGLGSPHTKVKAATRWARLLNQYRPLDADALNAFRTAINLLALIVGLEETIQRRYAIIQEYKDLPLKASTVAFRLGRPDLALEWLEHGRCLVWGQQSQLHTPLDELRAKNSELAERLMDVSKQLEDAGSSRRHSGSSTCLSEKASLEDEAAVHVRLAGMWEDLLTEARAIPGFETFLQPLQCSTILQHLPESGAIVAINVHEDRCDAIALSAKSNKPLHIPLPGFNLKKAKEHQDTLDKQLHRHQLRARDPGWSLGGDSGRALGRLPPRKKADGRPVHLVLGELWNDVVKPILNALALLKQDDASKETLPRIWWCPTGVLSFLPLHAAGVYKGSDPQNVMDYVVSSYTPTITTLTQRVMHDRPIDVERSGLFLTCQPKAPGAVPIPGTINEVLSISERATKRRIRSLKLEGDAVGPDQCLEHMEEFSSIHLACHASQNVSDPLQSRFLFHKGELNLGAIMRKNLKNSDLAFLSACKTSTGEAKIPDEAVHLAAGMLAAGYRRVIATMWSISDRHAPALATDFYEYLWTCKGEGSLTQFDGSLSAYALHHAIQQLRKRLDTSDNSLLAWVPYVHFGY